MGTQVTRKAQVTIGEAEPRTIEVTFGDGSQEAFSAIIHRALGFGDIHVREVWLVEPNLFEVEFSIGEPFHEEYLGGRSTTTYTAHVVVSIL